MLSIEHAHPTATAFDLGGRNFTLDLLSDLPSAERGGRSDGEGAGEGEGDGRGARQRRQQRSPVGRGIRYDASVETAQGVRTAAAGALRLPRLPRRGLDESP